MVHHGGSPISSANQIADLIIHAVENGFHKRRTGLIRENSYLGLKNVRGGDFRPCLAQSLYEVLTEKIY